MLLPLSIPFRHLGASREFVALAYLHLLYLCQQRFSLFHCQGSEPNRWHCAQRRWPPLRPDHKYTGGNCRCQNLFRSFNLRKKIAPVTEATGAMMSIWHCVDRIRVFEVVATVVADRHDPAARDACGRLAAHDACTCA